MYVGKTVRGEEQADDEGGPDGANNGECDKAMPRNPVHSGILENQ
jgi:hypothetical protein